MTKPINNRNVSCFGGGGLKKFSLHTKKIPKQKTPECGNARARGRSKNPGGGGYFCGGHNLPF